MASNATPKSSNGSLMHEPVTYLAVEDLVIIAGFATGAQPAVRDYGLLDSAANRPAASAFGQDAYPTLHQKAAALLHSIARNHALIDGNKRTAWLATYVFYDINGYDLDEPNDDEPVELVLKVARGQLEVDEMAAWLAERVKPR